MDYRIGPDDHFAPIDLRLLRANELEVRAAEGLNRLAATVQEDRSGRWQPLGKPCAVTQGLIVRHVIAVYDVGP